MAQHIWHPAMSFDQMSSCMHVVRAQGPWLYLSDGCRLFDATSSWWSQSLGYQHPQIIKACVDQMHQLSHVMLANIYHDAVRTLSDQLAEIAAPLDKVAYASDGSSVVEMAIKMSLHVRHIRGQNKKRSMLKLAHGYHGESLAAMSVSSVDLYKKPYQDMLWQSHNITPHYVNAASDACWEHDPKWSEVLSVLAPLADTSTLMIVEPLVQAAGGMRLYSKDFLSKLGAWCHAHDVHLIVDEIFTGMKRTGTWFAYQWSDVIPDFICTSKGLTSGHMPLSALMIHPRIYQYFMEQDYQNSFLHAQTYSGHAIATRAACTTIELLKEINEISIMQLSNKLCAIFDQVDDLWDCFSNIRSLGAWVAADCHQVSASHICEIALKKGLFMRPLGNVLYWVVPLNISSQYLEEASLLFQASVQEACNSVSV